MPAMPRTLAAVPIRPPIAATSSDPSITSTPTSPGLRRVDHLDRVLRRRRRRRLLGRHRAQQRRRGAPDERARHVGPDVVIEEAAAAADLVHRVRDVGRAQLGEAGEHRIGRRGRVRAGRLEAGGPRRCLRHRLHREQRGGHGGDAASIEMPVRQVICATPLLSAATIRDGAGVTTTARRRRRASPARRPARPATGCARTRP